ncbi:MAG: (2Fe-2S)-binding protein [Acidimicrobiia bacterium]
MTTLRVNGIERRVETHPEAALLWAVRDELGCTSVKYGCGAGHCGACRVVVDGIPELACQVRVGEAAGRDVRTLEGYLAGGATAVVEAILAADAGQCGFCLPGIATTLTALGARPGPPPSREDVVRAPDAHLCRCGAHWRILTAAWSALGCDG